MKPTLNMASPALLLLLLVWSRPESTSAEKLSVILPSQNTEFDIDNGHVDFDIRSSGGVGLSLPVPPTGVAPPTPSSPQLVLGAPPATLPTSPPGTLRGNLFGNNAGVSLQGSRPTINALYEVPDAGTEQQTIQGACQAQTVIVTSRATVTATQVSVSQIVVPTTIVQNRFVTTTATRVQTNFQTSLVTVQSPPQTIVESRTVTSQVIRSQTVYRTTTSVQRQFVTSTSLRVVTEVVTRPVTEEVTITSLRTQYISVPVTTVSTAIRTQVITSRISEPTYITVTSTETQFQPNTCATTGSTASYTYPSPGGSGSSYGSTYGGGSGYYGNGGNQGGYYLVGYQGGYGGGGYQGRPPYRRPAAHHSGKKGLFGKWF